MISIVLFPGQELKSWKASQVHKQQHLPTLTRSNLFHHHLSHKTQGHHFRNKVLFKLLHLKNYIVESEISKNGITFLYLKYHWPAKLLTAGCLKCLKKPHKYSNRNWIFYQMERSKIFAKLTGTYRTSESSRVWVKCEVFGIWYNFYMVQLYKLDSNRNIANLWKRTVKKYISWSYVWWVS